MSETDFETIISGVLGGQVVPYLGPGVLADVCHRESGEPIPADSDSLILAMNSGRPMPPKLMYEFPRAAMNLELKRGRRFIEQFLTRIYSDDWTRAQLHDWLASVRPAYVIDINRDTQLQDSYAKTPHLLIKGVSRIGGTDYRFILHEYDGKAYHAISPDKAPAGLPVLFKPMGSPVPEPFYVASDADYVDYITELMGGFGVPAFLKTYRKGLKYLFLGMRFTRDTERMVMSDITFDADEPAGWALIEQPTAKEERYCARKGIEIIEAGLPTLLEAARSHA